MQWARNDTPKLTVMTIGKELRAEESGKNTERSMYQTIHEK